jgi:transcriptional regulator with XRE-family HTH domain
MKTPTLADVVIRHRTQHDRSLRQFAQELNAGLINTGVTFATVRNWEQGEYPPRMDLLFECIATYDDWRAQFAADCLQAMYPDLVGSKIVINVSVPA